MSGVRTLSQLPFEVLIGGPLKAAVAAQAIAAETSVNFIQSVGFEAPVDGVSKVKNVSFSYKKTNESGEEKDFNLTVPILAILPIPYLQIETVDVDFVAKLTDMVESQSSSQSSSDGSYSASAGWGWGKASFRGSFSNSHNRTSKTTSTAEFTMNVKVHAVSAGMPDGMSRVLGILESVITEKEEEEEELP